MRSTTSSISPTPPSESTATSNLPDRPVPGWILDGGLAGFLPAALVPEKLSPQEIHKAGANPDFSMADPMGNEDCIVDLARQSLYAHWKSNEAGPGEIKKIIARSARLAAQIALGQGAGWMIAELETTAQRMKRLDIAAAATLLSALKHFKSDWLDHIQGRECPTQRCRVAMPPACQSACPAHIDIPGFMALMGSGDYEGAVEIISRDNPLPHVCGLICPAPCETACLRNKMDAPINIRPLKAVAARMALNQSGYPLPRPDVSTGKSVAVIGSGPAGLTAAFYLGLKGHAVSIYEAEKKAGGMLRYGIPEFRLPRQILDREIQWIQKAGVQIFTDQHVDRLDSLFEQGYDALYVAIGTQLARAIPMEGADLPYVIHGLDLLKAVNRGENPRVGSHVVVIGGGNVAIDVAMTALRQGAVNVRMVCLEKRKEMPANENEIRSALEEGIAIENGWGPLRATSDHQISFKACTRVFDSHGRFHPQYDESRTTLFETDHVILAIGQAADLTCVMTVDEVDTNRGLICVDPITSATNDPRVFAGGDVVSGPGLAVNAIRAGKQAAESIDAFIMGKELITTAWSTPQTITCLPPLCVHANQRACLKRATIAECTPDKRVCSYDCIELELDEKSARQEVRRCLRCDLCIGCGLCELVCSEMGIEALRFDQTQSGRLVFNDFMRPANLCTGCGACGQVCPTGAIQVIRADSNVRTEFTGTVVSEQPYLTCVDCGKPYITEHFQQALVERLDTMAGGQVNGPVCAACNRRSSANVIRALTNQRWTHIKGITQK